MKLPSWLRQVGRTRRSGVRTIEVTLTIDASEFERAIQGAADSSHRRVKAQRNATSRVGHQLLLVDVRREARQAVRDGVLAAHPWLRLPPKHARSAPR